MAEMVALAQGTMKGTITDAKTQEPLPFVNVIVKQDGKQVHGGSTDFDGVFKKLLIEKQAYHTTFYADRSVLQKIMANLLAFISRATPSKGVISLKIFELPALKSGYVHYRFSLQSGQTSVSEEEVRNRMEAFAWLERSNGVLRNESGMGLAISKGLAAAYQGSLDVKCVPEGGLEFITDMHFKYADAKQEHKKAAPISARSNLELQGHPGAHRRRQAGEHTGGQKADGQQRD